LNDPSLFKNEVGYINGQWIKATQSKKLEVLNPFNQSHVGFIPNWGAEETKQAIDAASKAFESWKMTVCFLFLICPRFSRVTLLLFDSLRLSVQVSCVDGLICFCSINKILVLS
jgi:hypothetical protein